MLSFTNSKHNFLYISNKQDVFCSSVFGARCAPQYVNSSYNMVDEFDLLWFDAL